MSVLILKIRGALYLWNAVFEFQLIENKLFEKLARSSVASNRNWQNNLLDVPETMLACQKILQKNLPRKGSIVRDSPSSLQPRFQACCRNSILGSHIRLQSFSNSSRPARNCSCKLLIQRVFESIRDIISPIRLGNTLMFLDFLLAF